MLNMKEFNYKAELDQIIEGKQLIELRVYDVQKTFNVAYVLNSNEKYLTVAEINPKKQLDGVCIHLQADICSIKVDTPYLKQFVEKIDPEFLYERALKDIEQIGTFSFEGFVSAFEKTNTLVEILFENGNGITGKVIDHSREVVVLDEFEKKYADSTGHSYNNFSSITRISVDIPYLNEIAKKIALQ